MKEINGILFKEMVIAGANVLHNNHREIDALNVFPVPDGDTGTNMSLTFSAGANDVASMETADIYEIARKLSKGLLMGARGNSGVILSQIFRGFAAALEGYKTVDAVALANALDNGTKVAYKAVMRPVEGTILTVIRESSAAVKEYAKHGMEIEEVFAYFLEEAEASLQRTPELLPVLKEVGVIDSGGAGLVLIFSGFMSALAGDTIKRIEISNAEVDGSLIDGASSDEFGYCTEFIVRLDDSMISKFNEDQLKNELERIPGDSIVVVQDEEIVKVHVHTLKPGNALNIAQRFGEFVKLKIENMQEQHNTITDAKEAPVKENPPKETAIISVCVGSGVEKAFLELHCDHVVSGGQTMNPSTEDLVQAVLNLNAKNVIILPNNSNIVMTAQQVATILEDKVNVIVIASKTIPEGLVALTMYNPNVDLEENIEEMEAAMKTVKTGQVTFAIKDTTIDGVEIRANEYMAICQKDIVACKPDYMSALKITLTNLVDEDSELITLLVGEGVQSDDVEEIESFVEDNFDAELEVIQGNQPVYSFIVGVE